jgi:hypothetical protein
MVFYACDINTSKVVKVKILNLDLNLKLENIVKHYKMFLFSKEKDMFCDNYENFVSN